MDKANNVTACKVQSVLARDTLTVHLTFFLYYCLVILIGFGMCKCRIPFVGVFVSALLSKVSSLLVMDIPIVKVIC
jgi:hypothetical protein